MQQDPTFSKPTKGRGANYNPANRFELLFTEKDVDWDPSEGPTVKTEYFKDFTKSILSVSNSPDMGRMVSVNPYRGCEHGCIYCYARPTHEYFGLSAGVDFESKIFVKEDAPELLRKEFLKKNWKAEVLMLSGNTDCFQPGERKLEITRRCLQAMLEFYNPVSVITKNHLVTRDIDILKEMAKKECACVNVSITTLDKNLARKMEPRASTPHDRLEAIAKLSQAGIPTRVMVAPILPGLTDHETPAILKAAKEAGAQGAGSVVLRLPYANKDLFLNWLDEHFPDRKNKIILRLKSLHNGKLYDSTWGQRHSGSGAYALQIEQLFDVSCRKLGLNDGRIQLTTENFRNPYREEQFELPLNLF